MRTLLALLLSALSVSAGTFYIDNSAGNDANNGTSTSTPWQHFPGDSAGGPSTTGISGTIYLKGGVTYNCLTPVSDGSVIASVHIDHNHYATGGPLLITSGATVSWGTGTSSIDGNGVSSVLFFTSGMTNVTIRGLTIGNTITPFGNGGIDAVVYFTNCRSNTVDTCVIHDTATNGLSHNSWADAIQIQSDTHPFAGWNIVTNCSIHDMTEKAVETFRCDNNTVVNNIMYNTPDHGTVFTSDNNRIFGNVISNTAVPIWSHPALDPSFACKFSQSSASSANSNWFFNNVVVKTGGGVDIDAETGGGLADDYNLVANNTFIQTPQANDDGGVRFDSRGVTANNNVVVNNIFTTEQVSGSIMRVMTPATTMGSTNSVAYNLWFGYNQSPTFPETSSGANPTWANFSDTGTTSPDNRFKVPANGTANSFPAGNQVFDSDPKFKSYSTGDFTLLDTSPARMAGTNLSAFFKTDIRGTTRGLWSMGAYEFQNFIPVITNVTLLLK